MGEFCEAFKCHFLCHTARLAHIHPSGKEIEFYKIGDVLPAQTTKRRSASPTIHFLPKKVAKVA